MGLMGLTERMGLMGLMGRTDYARITHGFVNALIRGSFAGTIEVVCHWPGGLGLMRTHKETK